MTDADCILAAVKASGLSARRFATHVLARDERTIRRWISGEMPIPAVAREWLDRWLMLSDGTRGRIVGALAAE